jgi:thiamine-monophosphate kinase
MTGHETHGRVDAWCDKTIYQLNNALPLPWKHEAVTDLTLGDFGERAIIDQILGPRYRDDAEPHFGDDCAAIELGDVYLVATTDPCPEPVAAYLGFDDWYYRGWLLGTINLSDLGSAGARPIGLLAAYELPPSTPQSDFERLLDGLDECLAEVGTRVLGGNIKEAAHLSLQATAFGLAEQAPPHRSNLSVGDRVYLVGSSGDFWATFMNYRQWPDEIQDDSEALAPVLTPRANLNVGIEIATRRIASAITDNSDGLYGALKVLGLESNVGFSVQLDDDMVTSDARRIAHRLQIDPVRFALGWGDWQLIVVVDASKEDELTHLCQTLGTPCYPLGEVTTGTAISAAYRDRRGELIPLDSERFSKLSWMTSGLGGYVDSLLGDPVIQ